MMPAKVGPVVLGKDTRSATRLILSLRRAHGGRDATASYSDREMNAAIEVNMPNYATAVVSTEEVVAVTSVAE
jgi:hypothetical protein